MKISVSSNLTGNLNSFTENFLALQQTDKDHYFVVKNDFSHAYANFSLLFSVKISVFNNLTENVLSLKRQPPFSVRQNKIALIVQKIHIHDKNSGNFCIKVLSRQNRGNFSQKFL